MKKKNNTFKIYGESIKAGTIGQFRLKVSESFVSIPTKVPVTVINGKKQGPALLITAAIHGNEINGIEVVRNLIHQIDPKQLSGTLICVPVVNIFGFQNSTRYLPDGHDLNRFFPGGKDSWAQKRYANIFFEEVVKLCTHHIDLHTAANGRSNLIHIRANMSLPGTAELAKSFGCSVILDSGGIEGSLRIAASEIGISSIVVEGGEPSKFNKTITDQGLYGVLNSMKSLGMIEGECTKAILQIVEEKTSWVRCNRGGILKIKTAPGRVVKKNHEIATSTNPFGKEVESIKASFDGIVIGIVTAPTVIPGDGVCHLMNIDKPVKQLRQELKEIFGKKRIVF